MSIPCITNDVPELRPCKITGEHAANCDGHGTRWDREIGKRVSTDAECKGCLPQPAEHWLLCWSCWEKLRDGLKIAVDMVTHLRSIERAQQQDNAGVRSAAGWVIPVPATWRTADDIIVLLGHPEPGFPSDAGYWEVEAITERMVDAITPEKWVASVAGAIAAVRFVAAMSTAMIQHPMEDYEHMVRNVRCPECKRRSLLWKPPLLFKGEVRIECTNPDCDVVVDQTGYGVLTQVEKIYVKERLSVERKKITDRKREARQAARAALAAARTRESEEMDA